MRCFASKNPRINFTPSCCVCSPRSSGNTRIAEARFSYRLIPPDFLNAIELGELFCIVKREGYSKIIRAIDMPLVSSLYKEGDKLGWLWNQGILPEAN